MARRSTVTHKADTELDERRELARDWLLQVKLAEKRNERWEKRCTKIIQRYRQDNGDGVDASSGINAGGARRMNMLWSNVQTLLPCVYGRQPVPIAERRFLDKDDTGRNASIMLERAMRYEMGFCGFHDTIEQGVLDYLLVGRGQAWLRFKPVIGPASSLTDEGDDQLTDRAGMPAPDEQSAEQTEENESGAPTVEPQAERLLSANVEVDYVYWKDFLHSRARFWKENTWVCRKLYPSRKDMIDDFGEKIGKAVPLELTPELSKEAQASVRANQMPDTLKKAIVYEIWDRTTRKVYTVAKGFDDFLEDPRDDPLNLEGFFPCPKPLFATMTNDTLEPVPDYLEYQDQALEIDTLTMRIDALMAALKVVGVYDASNKELARLLDEGGENKMIAVANWAAFSAKGGLPNAVSFLPIKEVAEVLTQLFEARDKIKQDMFEITGLADVIRGQADPRETAAAVATKGRWGSLRLQARQANVARFCRDIISMMGEIIAEHFPTETLVNVSGAMYDEGIGGAAPMPPQAGPNPMMGHNGGPALNAPPPANLNAPPASPQPPILPIAAAGPPALPSSSPPGATPGVPGVMAPAPMPAAPPDPMAQFAVEMQNYELRKQSAIQKAIDLLRQDKLRGFRIDIETDSTVNTDANEEKQARIQFVEALTTFMEKAFEVGSKVPEAVPLLGKSLLFAVRGFRAGRDLEATIEEFVDKVEKDAKQRAGMPPPPDPKVQKEQLDLQTQREKSKAEIANAQIEAQASREDNQREMATKQMDADLNRQKMQMEMDQMRQEMAMKTMEFEQRVKEMQMKMELASHDHSLKREQMDVAHQQHLERLRAEPKEKAA